MKRKTLLPVVLFLMVVICFYGFKTALTADNSHAGHGSAQAATDSADSPDGSGTEDEKTAAALTGEMKKHLTDMEEHLALIEKEKDPEKKNKMLHDHTTKMQHGMMMMHKMMEKRMDMMEKLIDMVDKRMDMMQKMMDLSSAALPEKKKE